MSAILEFLLEYKYLAMFGILVLCGLGLPVPEELTLVGSGLVVGWGKADFTYSAVACILGILFGDSVIFGIGYFYGEDFLRSRPMRLLLSLRRQRKVARFFVRHGNKTVFLARFFAGVRFGVYAYAGSQRMKWTRFLFLDFLGALISGPGSIWVGKWAAQTFADDAEEARVKALRIIHVSGHWIIGTIVVVISSYLVFLWVKKSSRKKNESRPLEVKQPGDS